MKFHEINKVFTEKVTEYLTRGYIINSSTMRGSQGEINKVDLVADDLLIRVWINDESEPWTTEGGYYGRKVVVRVSLCNRPVSSLDNYSTVWNKELETIWYKEFYKISEDWFVDDREEAMEIQKIRRDRYRRNTEMMEEMDQELVVVNSLPYKEIACRYLKNKVGYKRVSYDKLNVRKSIRKNNLVVYSVIYNGNFYRMK